MGWRTVPSGLAGDEPCGCCPGHMGEGSPDAWRSGCGGSWHSLPQAASGQPLPQRLLSPHRPHGRGPPTPPHPDPDSGLAFRARWSRSLRPQRRPSSHPPGSGLLFCQPTVMHDFQEMISWVPPSTLAGGFFPLQLLRPHFHGVWRETGETAARGPLTLT